MSPVHVLQMSPVHVLQMSPVNVLQMVQSRFYKSSPAFTTCHMAVRNNRSELAIANRHQER